MGKYGAPTAWLMAQIGGRIAVAFGAIEQILGSQLPYSARHYRPWWGNELNARGRQCRAWLIAGWHVEAVDLANERVVFAR